MKRALLISLILASCTGHPAYAQVEQKVRYGWSAPCIAYNMPACGLRSILV